MLRLLLLRRLRRRPLRHRARRRPRDGTAPPAGPEHHTRARSLTGRSSTSTLVARRSPLRAPASHSARQALLPPSPPLPPSPARAQVVLPDVGLLVALVGAFTTTTIAAFPFLMQLRLAAAGAVPPLGFGRTLMAVWMVAFSWMVMVLGTYTALGAVFGRGEPLE